MFYVNVETGLFIKTDSNFENTNTGAKPVFVCNSVAVIDITFLNPDKTPFDLTGGEIVLAVDPEFFPETLSAGASAEIVDAAAGHARFEVNCTTDRFKSKVITNATTGKIEATFFPPGGDYEQVLLQDVATMKSRVLGNQGEPVSGDPEYYSAAQVDAKLNAGDEYQFSADCEEWHSEQTSTDVYMRSRNRSVGGEWSDSILIPSGKNGDAGATFTPAISEEGVLSWSNNGDLENPSPVNLKGNPGDPGPQGPDGAAAVSWAVLTSVSDSNSFSGTAQVVRSDGTMGETVEVVFGFEVT